MSIQQKKVVAVRPYLRDSGCNFKMFPYYAWGNCGGKVASSHYPMKCLHGFAYRFDYPTLIIHSEEARLRFVEVNSITFDTFPDYLTYEIIPIIWDCWPMYDSKLIKWLLKHKVKACVMTSSQAAERIHNAISELKILTITEGISTEKYQGGVDLSNRTIDLYTYGRLNDELFNLNRSDIVESRGGAGNLLFERLQDAKITIALPQCDVLPERTGGQETLTQRFWECMLSKTVLLGRAPRELVDLIGYNPVIDIDYDNYEDQLREILSHISDYQSLVDKNRETALRMAPWEIRMNQVMEWLKSIGYEI